MGKAGEPPAKRGSQGSEPASFTERMLDAVERFGNKVPHPVMIFVILTGCVIVLSHILWPAIARGGIVGGRESRAQTMS